MSQVTPFAAAIEALQPGAGGRAIAKLLDGRATRHAALNWKAGRRSTPQWAIDCLRQKLHDKHASESAAIERLTAGPGKRAGAANLAAYRARSG